MGTLSSELAPHAERLAPRPRIYADANVPAGLVEYMRHRLNWDVLFVLEEDDLRRASDRRHYQLASQLRRTLITLDRDYLDDRRFPPTEGAGVLVLSAPNGRELTALLRRVERTIFGPVRLKPDATGVVRLKADASGVVRVTPDTTGIVPAHSDAPAPLPLDGRKMHLHTDWGRSDDVRPA